MHFLAEGRNDRIQRWIAEQTQSPNTGEPSEVLETAAPEVAATTERSSTEGKGEDGVYWQMEELEREMALTAYAFGRKNWPVSTGSIDTNILDFADIKRLSQLAIEQDVVEDDHQSSVPPRQHDKRRDARIVSQPPELPPTPQSFDLPSPIIHRAVPAPAPIETTSRISDIPPIAFVLQETASPGSNSIHFTPIAPDNLDAFPSTPRSFTSFLKHMSDNNGQNQIKFQELFLSPRLITPKVPISTQNTLLSSVIHSPATLYSLESDSCQSTPSLSAFPPTPASNFSQNIHRFGVSKRETDMMPPVPEVPPGPLIVADQIVESPTVDEKVPPSAPLPTPDFSEFPINKIEIGSSMNGEKPVAQVERRDTEALSDSASITASDIFSGQLSSRFSVFSSKFSNSSLEDLDKSANDSKGRWTPIKAKGYGGHSRSRATSVSTGRTGASKKNVHITSHSRAGSRNEIGQSVNSRGHHSRTASKAGSRSGSSKTTADLSTGLSSLDTSISEEISLVSESQMDLNSSHPTALRGSSASPGDNSGAVGESPTHKTTNFKGRTLISRISMGLRRSRSFGSNNSRPVVQRSKTHAATLSGSNVSEHVYFNTNTSAGPTTTTSTTTAVQKPNAASDSISVATSPTLQGSVATSFSNVSPSPKQPPRLTLTTQFASITSTPVMRNTLTPKTPASSMSTSFSKIDSTPAEPLPTIKWLECLILRGVNRDNRYDEPVIKWCQQLGEVDDILRVRGSGTIVVYFKEEEVMKRNRGVFEPREVNIAGVGIVTINWSRTMLPPERKLSSS